MINFPSRFWEFLDSISGQSHGYTRWLCTKCTSGDLGCRWVVQVASKKIEIEVVKQDMWILLAKTRRISHNWSTVWLLWTAHWQIGGQRQRNSCPEGLLEAGAVTISLWGGCRGCRWSCSVWGFTWSCIWLVFSNVLWFSTVFEIRIQDDFHIFQGGGFTTNHCMQRSRCFNPDF